MYNFNFILILISVAFKDKSFLQVRRYLRGYFLDHDHDDFSFWLSAILRTQQSVAKQGRLFMILYCPTIHQNGKGILDAEFVMHL